MMKITIICLIAAVALLGSCTIEKRLYNKGWHVEFHRNHHSDETKATRPSSAIADLKEKAPASEHVSDSLLPNQTSGVVSEDRGKEMADIEESQKEVMNNSAINYQQPIIQQKTKGKIFKATAFTTYRNLLSRPWSRESKQVSMTIVGIFLLIGLLTFISLLSVLLSATSIVEVIAFAVFVYFIALIDLILLIVFLIMLSNKSREQIAEEERDWVEQKRSEEKMSAEEREQYENDKAKKSKEGKIAAGFVVIVLLLILAVALL